MEYLIYCDESCPLEHEPVSLFGVIGCSSENKKTIVKELRELKEKHFYGFSRQETKWTKISSSKKEYYKELIKYFKNKDDIRVRILVVKNKEDLDNKKYNEGDYQTWYYKMYFYLLDRFLDANSSYYMMYDEKDTHTTYRMNEVKRIITGKKNYREDENFDLKIKQINSKESELMQLLDVIMGAVGYKNRGYMDAQDKKETTKQIIVEYIEKECKKNLSQTTSPFETKFNIFIWNPRKSD